MAPTNRVTYILPEPNADGNNVIGITLGDESTFDVTIDSAAAQTLVEILQRRLVRLAQESAKNLSFPQFDVSDVGVAHKGPAAQLMVSIAQSGWWVLRMPDDVLQKAQREIGRLVTWRFGSPTKQ
jgi:hypothetical protein